MIDSERKRIAGDIYRVYESGGAVNFTAQLIRLIAKADPDNRHKLGQGFPVEVSVFDEWHTSHSLDVFYKKYGVGRG